MTALRVLHVLDHSIPLHSGYTFRTLAILREQRRMGWQTFHLTSPKHLGSDVAEEEVEGLRFYRTPGSAESRLQFPGLGELGLMRQLEQRLQRVVEQVRPHVLHAHSPVLDAIPALRVGRRLGIPVVYEVRAFWEDAAVDHGTASEGGLRYRLSRWLESYACEQVDHVFTICEGLRSDIVSRGIPASKVTVIPNAVDVESFVVGGEPDPALRARLGLAGRTIVGFIGSFYAYEGLDLLLDAMPHMLRSSPDLRVLLVGGGPQEDALKGQASRLGLADKIVFAGRVSHDEVQRYYDLIDVLVYPRHAMRLTELVTPLKPLEAMAQGKVLVASDVGGHKELVRHGENGILFRSGDVRALSEAVAQLLARKDTWPKLRDMGRGYVERERNWRKSVEGYRDVYGALTVAGVE